MRDLAALKIMESLRPGTGRKGSEGSERRKAMRAAILASDGFDTIQSILGEGVTRNHRNGIKVENRVPPSKTKRRFRNAGSQVQTHYIIKIPESQLYNPNMPRSNVRERSVQKAAEEEIYRRDGGYKKRKTTNGQGFVYVPDEFSVGSNGTIHRYAQSWIPTTTAETLRRVPRSSIEKPPPRRAKPFDPFDLLY